MAKTSNTVQNFKNHTLLSKTQLEISLAIFTGTAYSIMDFLKFTGETTIGGAPIICLDSQICIGEPTIDGEWYNDPSSPGLEQVGK